ncbi:MAG: hypothetical protein FWG11_06485 [Promicromonosporaceae bacterium]|nr:hypothetical protein [Promicromonosporaceae bacterium]
MSVPSKRRAPKADKVILSSPRRTVEFSIRLTPDERDAWHAAAQAAGSSSTAAYFRDIGNAHIEGRKIQEPDPNILALLHEWQQIGKNLNQIPLGINRANLIGSPVHLEQIAGHLAVIRGVIDNDRDTLAAAA